MYIVIVSGSTAKRFHCSFEWHLTPQMTLSIETCISQTPCIKRTLQHSPEGVHLIQVSLYLADLFYCEARYTVQAKQKTPTLTRTKQRTKQQQQQKHAFLNKAFHFHNQRRQRKQF